MGLYCPGGTMEQISYLPAGQTLQNTGQDGLLHRSQTSMVSMIYRPLRLQDRRYGVPYRFSLYRLL